MCFRERRFTGVIRGMEDRDALEPVAQALRLAIAISE
jgi:hypothetical protein